MPVYMLTALFLTSVGCGLVGWSLASGSAPRMSYALLFTLALLRRTPCVACCYRKRQPGSSGKSAAAASTV